MSVAPVRAWLPPVVIAHDDCPPSLNRSNHPSSHRIFLQTKAAWQRILWAALLQSDLPRGCAYIHADGLLRFPQNRRRDAGNFKTVLEKALGDALQQGPRPFLTDDVASAFQFGMLAIDPVRGPKLTRIRLAHYMPDGAA